MNKWKESECKYHHFATPNEFMSLMVNNIEAKNNNQTSCAPWWESMTPLSIILLKALNLRLIKTLDLAAHFQEIQRREEQVEVHHECAMCKIQAMGNPRVQATSSSTHNF